VRIIPILEALTLAVLLLLPLGLDFFWIVFVTKLMLLAMLAISFDLNWGYSGIMSFGQALFFGTGAYTVAILGRDLGAAQIFLTLPAAALSGLALALLLAWFLLLGRRTPSVIFVALGTLTGSYAAERLVNASQYLGGRNGISGVPIPMAGPLEFVEGSAFYYLALVFLLVSYLLARFLVRSQFGLVLAGMREQEQRLAFLGYRVQLFKAIVFSAAGLLAAVAGGLYAYHEGYAGPVSLGMQLSTMAVLYGLFGGIGTLVGAVLGTFAIETMSFFLADSYQSFWPVILGLIMLLVITLKPTGLMGVLVTERERVGDYGRPPRTAEQGRAER
jgi:branched-chain amino acid transport system permease protein